MQVIAHDGIGVNTHRENLAKLLDTRFDDGLAVFEGLLGIAVDTAEPSTPHASGNAVVGPALAGFEEIATRVGHGGDGRLSACGWAVGGFWDFL